jgi:hypothetical protein
MLTDRITIPLTSTASPEDYLSTSLGVIFPDDITNQHGDASCPVIYSSPKYGDIELRMADPQGEQSRRLFSHHLWNAGVQMAACIEDGSQEEQRDVLRSADHTNLGDGVSWSVKEERVLELGAGTGLAGIIAAKAGAREVVLTDYPAPEVLANLRVNVKRNLEVEGEGNGLGNGRFWVTGHVWGDVPDGLDDNEGDAEGAGEKQPAAGPRAGEEVMTEAEEKTESGTQGEEAVEVEAEMNASDSLESTIDADTIHEKPAATIPSVTTSPQPLSPQHFALANAHSFTRILLADCLWLPSQHRNLHRSLAWFLAAPPHGRAWVIAGFHTGRTATARFFDAQLLRAAGLRVERIWERDATGRERPWVADRGVEDPTARKRWLVMAVLKRVEGQW